MRKGMSAAGQQVEHHLLAVLAGLLRIQQIAAAQSPAFQSAELSPQISALAAHDDGHVVSAGNSQISPAADDAGTEAQDRAGLDGDGTVHGHLLAVDHRAEIAAGNGDERIRRKLDRRAHEGDFQGSLVFIIADQYIRQPQGIHVHRPRRDDADLLVSIAPRILNRRQQARTDNVKTHGRIPPLRLQILLQTRRKTSRGRRRAADSDRLPFSGKTYPSACGR